MRHSVERPVFPANVDEFLPDFAAFSYGAQGDGISDHGHQTLGPSHGRVQEFRIGEKPVIGIVLVLFLHFVRVTSPVRVLVNVVLPWYIFKHGQMDTRTKPIEP